MSNQFAERPNPNHFRKDNLVSKKYPRETHSYLRIIYLFLSSKTKLVDVNLYSLQEKAGSNLVTITCVNKETLANAENEPQKFDLVRNRMGGWSNFFVAMFPEHKKQHQRRMYFGPHKDST